MKKQQIIKLEFGKGKTKPEIVSLLVSIGCKNVDFWMPFINSLFNKK